LPVHPGGPKILNLRNPKTNFDARQYARYVDTDPGMPFEIYAPTRKAAMVCRKQINFAFNLMDAGDPVLAGEIRVLIREIALAAGSTQKNAYTFDGVSSFMLWGAIVINAGRAREPLTMVRMLAHESAHNLLFGMAMDEPLLKNSSAERYKSPVRDDLRPIEGIYHAVFVCARMFRVVKMLLKSGKLPIQLEKSAHQSLETDARCFVEGMKVIRQHAKLTKIGRTIIQNVADFMDAAR
jgi:HEXXH motif-containing protein